MTLRKGRKKGPVVVFLHIDISSLVFAQKHKPFGCINPNMGTTKCGQSPQRRNRARQVIRLNLTGVSPHGIKLTLESHRYVYIDIWLESWRKKWWCQVSFG